MGNKVVDRFGDDLSGLTFSIWGLSFKPGTDDVREATSIVVISELIKRGAKIKAYDPQATEEFKRAIDDEFDFELFEEKLNQKIIFDGRNIYDKKIEKLGFELFQIGC